MEKCCWVSEASGNLMGWERFERHGEKADHKVLVQFGAVILSKAPERDPRCFDSLQNIPRSGGNCAQKRNPGRENLHWVLRQGEMLIGWGKRDIFRERRLVGIKGENPILGRDT